MKYNMGKVVTNGIINEIDLRGIKEDKVKDLLGKLFCPGDNCMAPLFISHNSRNGGKTIHFKARNEKHLETCPYKDENYKELTKKIPVGGYYTEEQINTYVRTLNKDVTNPVPPDDKKNVKKPREKSKTSKLVKDKTSKIVKGGKIIFGDAKNEENKGRMSRRYQITSDDIGSMVGVYGYIDNIIKDKNDLYHIKYKEDRLSNLDILIGSVYKNNNPDEFSRMGQLLKYYDILKKESKEVFCTSGGLVIEYNGQLTIELQTNHSFVVNGLNITNIARNNVKK